jgi:4-hydroxyphenylpyruvate dioxygenase
MRVALNQSCLPGITTAEFVAIAAECGAEGVELRLLGAHESPLTMGTAARAGGLPVDSVGPLMDWALPDDLDRREELEALLEVASMADSHVVVCVGPMSERPLPAPAEMIAAATDKLSQLAEFARGSGVRLALEPVGLSSSRPRAVSGLRALADARSVIDAVGADAGLCLDSYNVATAGVAYSELATVPADRIAIVQFADRDPVSPWRALPGEGDLDLFPFVEALETCGYAGAISVETFPQEPWQDPRAAARRALVAARRFVRKETSN